MDFLTLINSFASKLPAGQSLSRRQMDAAKAMYSESLKQGVDPRLVIAMGYQESALGGKGPKAIYVGDTNRGEDHAIGYLQVLRSTANQMGLLPEWEAAKKKHSETGEGDPDLSAKLGVAYVRTLVDKHKASTVADIAAGYNGGPGKIGKNYGKATPYVQKVTKLMGLFGDGAPVSWKQTGLTAAGQFAALEADAAQQTAAGRSSPARLSPVISPFSVPAAQAPQSPVRQQQVASAPARAATPAPTPGDGLDGGFFESFFSPQGMPSAQPEPSSYEQFRVASGLTAGQELFDLRPDGEDPVMQLRKMVRSLYDEQIAIGGTNGELNG